jgi:hypothetical protein
MLLSQSSGIKYFVDIIISMYSWELRTGSLFWTWAPSLPWVAEKFPSSQYICTSLSDNGHSSFYLWRIVSITGVALMLVETQPWFVVYAMFIQSVSLCVRVDTMFTEHRWVSKYNPCTLVPEDCSDGAESLGDAKRCDRESSAVTFWVW